MFGFQERSRIETKIPNISSMVIGDFHPNSSSFKLQSICINSKSCYCIKTSNSRRVEEFDDGGGDMEIGGRTKSATEQGNEGC